jgi:hypothetical protein
MLEVSPSSSTVHFTSLSPSSVADFQRTLDKPRPAERAIAPGHGAAAACHTYGILALLAAKNIPLDRCCLLDPKATEPVAPGDSELFDVFLFGGILGDDPPLDRTRILRREGFPSRHLGPVQMTTDTALAVTKRVVIDGSAFIRFSTLAGSRERRDVPAVCSPAPVFLHEGPSLTLAALSD